MKSNRSFRFLMEHLFGRSVRPIMLSVLTRKNFFGAALIFRMPKFEIAGELVIGQRFTMYGKLFASQMTVGKSATITIGDDVFINQGCRIHADDAIEIGSRTEIGDLVSVYDTNFHPVEPGENIKTSPVRIGEDCWIGTGSIILPGVNLGRGVVVAGGTVVTKSFPSGSLIAGNPATLIRTFYVPDDFRRRGPNRSPR